MSIKTRSLSASLLSLLLLAGCHGTGQKTNASNECPHCHKHHAHDHGGHSGGHHGHHGHPAAPSPALLPVPQTSTPRPAVPLAPPTEARLTSPEEAEIGLVIYDAEVESRRPAQRAWAAEPVDCEQRLLPGVEESTSSLDRLAK